MDGIVSGISFSVVGWAAWAPGLETADQWRAWSDTPTVPLPDGSVPALSDVPAMQRRRIDPVGRMAIAALDACAGPRGSDAVPLIFASRHGAVASSVQLLDVLGRNEPLAPTTFSLSVHNAVAAQYSIVRGHRGNYLAMAGGRCSVEAACVEAAGLLSDGAPHVMVVCCDGPVPGVYADFIDEPDAAFAWCWKLARPGKGGDGVQLSLDWNADVAGDAGHAPGLPHGLDVHRFLLSGQTELTVASDGQGWRWSRHD